MNTRRRLGLAIVVIAAIGCGGGGTSSTGTNTGGNSGGTNTGGNSGGTNNNCTAGDGTICVLSGSFNPVDITISKNTSVTFQEVAGVHTIVFDAPFATGVSDIGAFSSGTVSRTFTEAGTFPYHCTIHGGAGTGMHGTIKVQ